jgi:hypothetical protein
VKRLHTLAELEALELYAILAEERPGEYGLATWYDPETRTHHPLAAVSRPSWLGVRALGEQLAARHPGRSYVAVKFGKTCVLEQLGGGPEAPAGEGGP